jgi:hypothetical protein
MAMKFTTGEVDITDTQLAGYVTATYAELVATFGEPTFVQPSGAGKTQAEWHVTFEDGTIATIYDYKSLRPIKKITEWHIGGRELDDAHDYVNAVVSDVRDLQLDQQVAEDEAAAAEGDAIIREALELLCTTTATHILHNVMILSDEARQKLEAKLALINAELERWTNDA